MLTDTYGRVNSVVNVTSADSLSFKISREFECKQKYPRIKVGRELRYQYDICLKYMHTQKEKCVLKQMCAYKTNNSMV